MLKVLSFRFHQSFGPFTMLLVEITSETGLFKHLYSHVFRSPELKKYITYKGDLCFENLQN